MAATSRVGLLPAEQVRFENFHPEWETLDSKFWFKRVALILFAAISLGLIIYWGYTTPTSPMTATFQESLRIIEFVLWSFNTFCFIEMWQIARHKTQTTRIKFDLSHNEEMRVSIQFNRSFGLLFLSIFFYYFLKIIFRYIFNFSLPFSNIWRTPPQGGAFHTAFAALEVVLGFGAYAQFIYVFEKTVQGRKFPVFWIVPVLGVAMMILLPYDLVIFSIPFSTSLVLDVNAYYFSMIFALFGGIIVPVLYFIMGKRFNYAGKAQVSKDCYRKGWGFTIMAIAAIFNFNALLVFESIGGIPYYAEIVTMIFLAPIFTFSGFILVRTAYRPHS